MQVYIETCAYVTLTKYKINSKFNYVHRIQGVKELNLFFTQIFEANIMSAKFCKFSWMLL